MENKPVLIVDDEESIRLTLACTLEDLGLVVEAVEDGEQALERLTARDFEMAFLDLRLPGIDGFEVLRQARTLRPAMPVIVMTAYASVESKKNALRLGATEFIQKPFTPRIIRMAVLGMRAHG